MRRPSGLRLCDPKSWLQQTVRTTSDTCVKILLTTSRTGTEYFLASFIAVYTIEKLGRRKLMLFGASVSFPTPNHHASP